LPVQRRKPSDRSGKRRAAPPATRARRAAAGPGEADATREQHFRLTRAIAEPFDLYGHLPFRLATLTNLLALDRDVAIPRAGGLGLRELRVLLNVGSYMPIRAADVAFQTRLDPITVSRGVQTLLRLRLIRMSKDPSDRRSQFLSLTAAGESRYRRIVAVLAERDRAIADALTAAERAQLHALLARLERLAERWLAEHALEMLARGERISADQRELIRWRKRSIAGR
jgi:DNA-binding MarR family transcriptional regulator